MEQREQHGGRECVGGSRADGRMPVVSQADDCEMQPCRGGGEANADCVGDWGEWGQCTVTCGGGTKRRLMKVVKPATGSGKKCLLRPNVVVCNVLPCPVANSGPTVEEDGGKGEDDGVTRGLAQELDIAAKADAAARGPNPSELQEALDRRRRPPSPRAPRKEKPDRTRSSAAKSFRDCVWDGVAEARGLAPACILVVVAMHIVHLLTARSGKAKTD